MSSNLYRERYSGRAPAWHELGLVKPEGWPTAVAAFKEGKLDYEVVKLPLVGKRGNKQVEVPNKFGLFRAPNYDDKEYAFLGIAGSGYHTIQNMELARMVDELGLTAKWPVETVGALDKGQTTFLTLDAGTTEIAKEETKLFFLISDTRDAKTALSIAFTPVTVVCSNTLVAGLRAATRLVRVTHNQHLEIEARDRMSLMGGLEKAKDDTLIVFNRLATLKVNNEQISAAIEATYPDPLLPSRLTAVMDAGGDVGKADVAGLWTPASIEKLQYDYNREVGRVNVLRDLATEKVFEYNDTRPTLAGTAWGVYQALVDVSDYRAGPISSPASALWGERAQEKVRCLDYLERLI